MYYITNADKRKRESDGYFSISIKALQFPAKFRGIHDVETGVHTHADFNPGFM
jgi:hypothetical protein